MLPLMTSSWVSVLDNEGGECVVVEGKQSRVFV